MGDETNVTDSEELRPVVVPDETILEALVENESYDQVNGGDGTFSAVTPFQNEVIRRLDNLEATVEGLRDGVNMVGTMMNSVADMFNDMVTKVNQGGIGALLGNLMGKNNG